ncbi:unnamed protein product [Urochloa humidicola]
MELGRPRSSRAAESSGTEELGREAERRRSRRSTCGGARALPLLQLGFFLSPSDGLRSGEQDSTEEPGMCSSGPRLIELR